MKDKERAIRFFLLESERMFRQAEIRALLRHSTESAYRMIAALDRYRKDLEVAKAEGKENRLKGWAMFSHEEFDRDFKRMQKFAVVSWGCGLAVTFGLLGFGIWVVVKVMAHFGVI